MCFFLAQVVGAWAWAIGAIPEGSGCQGHAGLDREERCGLTQHQTDAATERVSHLTTAALYMSFLLPPLHLAQLPTGGWSSSVAQPSSFPIEGRRVSTWKAKPPTVGRSQCLPDITCIVTNSYCLFFLSRREQEVRGLGILVRATPEGGASRARREMPTVTSLRNWGLPACSSQAELT